MYDKWWGDEMKEKVYNMFYEWDYEGKFMILIVYFSWVLFGVFVWNYIWKFYLFFVYVLVFVDDFNCMGVFFVVEREREMCCGSIIGILC